ncbi:MAG: hypothetical protein NZ551_08120 [Microscillaceae bacterium]|nr:hypothetical protein [Microscillaceae bacterium]MDW8461163.1 hypothetical protein [Cytophagales bacterium]
MKNILWIFTFLLCLLIGTSYAQAQDITELDKNESEAKLLKNPKDLVANFIVGAYYYNKATEIEKEIAKASFSSYIEAGKNKLEELRAMLKKALPYLENAYFASNKSEPKIAEALEDIYFHLGMKKKPEDVNGFNSF